MDSVAHRFFAPDVNIHIGLWLSLLVLGLYVVAAAYSDAMLAFGMLVGGGIGLTLTVNPVLALYFVSFALFSGLFWGLGVGGGFLVLTLITIVGLTVVKFVKLDYSLILGNQRYWLLGYWFFLLTSVLAAYWPMYSFKYLLVYAKLTVFYLLIVNILSDRRHIRNFVYVATLATLISIVYGFAKLAQKLLASEISLDSRLRGLTDDPNILALHIIFLVPVVLFFAFYVEQRWKKTILFSVFGIFCAGLVATFSRGGFVAFVFVMVVALYRRRSWKVAIVTMGIFLLLVVLFVPKDFWSHLGKLWDLGQFLQDRSLRERSHLLMGAWSLFKQHTLFGVGIGNFLLLSQKFVPESLAVHDIFLQVAVETGVFGALCFLGLMVSTFRNYLEAYRFSNSEKRRTDAILYEGLAIGFGGITVASLFLSTQEYFVLWAVFALSVVAKRLAGQGTRITSRDGFTQAVEA